MYKYEVGQIIPEYKTRTEQIKFDIADDGAILIIGFPGITKEEQESVRNGKFEIRFTTLYNVIMLTFKFSSLNWMDAPYSSHLSKNLTKFEFPQEGQGLGLMVYLVDTVTGELKVMRLLGLSERFTRSLLGKVMEEKMTEFNKQEYGDGIKKIYAKYPTSEIVKLSKDYCKIG